MDHSGAKSYGDLVLRIFEPDIDAGDVWKIHGLEAIVFLARSYAESIGEDPGTIHFNELGIMETLERFARDAWGVDRFHKRVNDQFALLGINKDALAIVEKELHDVGIRVNTRHPRKTRVAACFALWMSTLRPLFVDAANAKSDLDVAKEFCAAFTYTLCTEYLSMFGEVVAGSTDEDAAVRIQHVVRDFHCRQLGLSPLELLFCGLFRAEPKPK